MWHTFRDTHICIDESLNYILSITWAINTESHKKIFIVILRTRCKNQNENLWKKKRLLNWERQRQWTRRIRTRIWNNRNTIEIWNNMLNPPITLVLRRLLLLRYATLTFCFYFIFYFPAVHGCKILLHIPLHMCVCDLKFTPWMRHLRYSFLSAEIECQKLWHISTCIGWEN